MNGDPYPREPLPDTTTREGTRASGWRRQLVEFVVTVLLAFALAFGFVKPVVADAYRIPSGSMEPTLHGCKGCNNDRVIANKFVYRFSEPERGDVVVFESVEGTGDTLIKRVVGVSGDEIRVQDGTLFVNGEPGTEAYVNRKTAGQSAYGPVTVPPGHVFVMGDNRGNSRDSRFYGPVPYENIEGEAFGIFWPPSRVGGL